MTINLTPPIADVRPHELTTNGHTRVDNYYWLREKTDQDVLDYLTAENEYTKTMTSHTKDLQETLYQEMVGRIQETDSTAPYKKGSYFYYTRTEAGKQYKIHCRKLGTLDAEEEIILDENVLAEGTSYFRVGIAKVSPNEQLLAYSTDTKGSERYTLVVKNLTTGELLPDTVENTFYYVQWANDNQTLFYATQNDAWRSHKILRHTLGTNAASDVVLFHEEDELFNVWIGKTRDNAYLMMTSESLETTEPYFLDANDANGAFTRFVPRQKGILAYLDHRKGMFFMRTNEDAKNFKVIQVPVATPQKANWQTLIPHNPDKLVEEIELFDGFMAVNGRFNGLQTIDIHNFDTGEIYAVQFPEPVYATSASDNAMADADNFRFVYTSLTTSNSVVDYGVNGRSWTLIKQDPVLGNYDPANYETERIWATATDGTKVPISLVYRKGTERNGSNSCLLYAYGSYGSSTSPAFDQKRLSLIDRGFIYAIAHVRGGQEMGRHWYEDGKFLNKKNTFTDFIACAKHLIAENYTSTEMLGVNGRSAGGLLMGAITTMAPDLFKAVVAGVPFVDVVTTILDENLPLSVGEWEEWGNPNKEDFYNYMLSYSPYDNTTPQDYPHLLITGGLNDPRVSYWEPAKWAAKLRTVKTNNNQLLLKIHMGAGHFSASGRYDYLRDIAFEYAFLLDVLGVEGK